jgi:hypothetical protein
MQHLHIRSPRNQSSWNRKQGSATAVYRTPATLIAKFPRAFYTNSCCVGDSDACTDARANSSVGLAMSSCARSSSLANTLAKGGTSS